MRFPLQKNQKHDENSTAEITADVKLFVIYQWIRTLFTLWLRKNKAECKIAFGR